MKLTQKIKAKLRDLPIHRLGLLRPAPQSASKSRYDHLLDLFSKHNPTSMIEIGVWRGDRTIRFLAEGKALRRYIGFDLFEEMTSDKFIQESMGTCIPQSKKDVMQLIEPFAKQRGCQVELIAGLTEETLPKFIKDNAAKFDFVYIDGGHSIETVASDWKYAKELVTKHGIVIFDDYYLNDDKRGVKSLIDELLKNPNYRVRFFPMIEDIIEDIQITMVAVWQQN